MSFLGDLGEFAQRCIDLALGTTSLFWTYFWTFPPVTLILKIKIYNSKPIWLKRWTPSWRVEGKVRPCPPSSDSNIHSASGDGYWPRPHNLGLQDMGSTPVPAVRYVNYWDGDNDCFLAYKFEKLHEKALEDKKVADTTHKPTLYFYSSFTRVYCLYCYHNRYDTSLCQTDFL